MVEGVGGGDPLQRELGGGAQDGDVVRLGPAEDRGSCGRAAWRRRRWPGRRARTWAASSPLPSKARKIARAASAARAGVGGPSPSSAAARLIGGSLEPSRAIRTSVRLLAPAVAHQSRPGSHSVRECLPVIAGRNAEGAHNPVMLPFGQGRRALSEGGPFRPCPLLPSRWAMGETWCVPIGAARGGAVGALPRTLTAPALRCLPSPRVAVTGSARFPGPAPAAHIALLTYSRSASASPSISSRRCFTTSPMLIMPHSRPSFSTTGTWRMRRSVMSAMITLT